MHIRIEPQPTPQHAAAITAALEELFARPDTSGRELRFSDATLARSNSGDARRADAGLADQMNTRRYTWRDVARIEALIRGV